MAGSQESYVRARRETCHCCTASSSPPARQVQGQLLRTEPEIDATRQEELLRRRTLVPDIEKGIYPFKGEKLSRADVEWLLGVVLRRQRKFGSYVFSGFLDLLAGYGYRPARSVLFEILFIIRPITFCGIRMQHRQKRHTLPGNFSSLQRGTVATRQALVNDHFRQTYEKFYGRSDAAPEALSASHAKRIASETMTFYFS